MAYTVRRSRGYSPATPRIPSRSRKVGGWGRVGWLPCGPGDWFHPWYGGWGARYGVVGVGGFGALHDGFSPLGRGGRFSNFDEAMRNDRVRAGFTSMGGNEFGRGAVSMHQEGISEASFRQASVMTGRMSVNPSRESFSPSNREPNASTIRNGSAAGSQHFFSSNRGGFTGGAENRGNYGSGGNHTESSINNNNRGNAGAPNNWHSFTPAQGGANRSEQGFGNSRGSSSAPSHQFNSPNTASRGGYGGSSNSYYRPPLNMRQPIVTPRGGYNESSRGGNSGGYNNASRGGSYGGSNAPRPSYNAPRSFGAPQGGGYHGGSGGGGSSHSSGGGSHGGGGGSHGGHSR